MDKSKTALLIIDYQVVDFNRTEVLHNSEDLKNNIKSLVTRARKKNIPIFLTKHNGKLGSPSQKGLPGWSIHPSLELEGDEIIIEKNYPDSFQQTNLEAELKLRAVNHLVMLGLKQKYVSTQLVVKHLVKDLLLLLLKMVIAHMTVKILLQSIL
ncbi:isochorismatase family protein [Niallia circulans]|uniref:Isochorismatase family protein n=1 Tax=Niallia circulans TaxID=1397 RepID=A0A553SU12_NIACI|nr:isochorismatase family protein [Niallia circulans]TRZ40480.1 isochorismatase family protein [Niallia circulans]